MNKFFLRCAISACVFFVSSMSFAEMNSTAQTDCQIMAESYVVDVDATAPALYMGQTREGEAIFHVKALVHGKKSLFEVVLKPAECDFVSLRSL